MTKYKVGDLVIERLSREEVIYVGEFIRTRDINNNTHIYDLDGHLRRLEQYFIPPFTNLYKYLYL